jgi:hypothetical protein
VQQAPVSNGEYQAPLFSFGLHLRRLHGARQ